MPPRAKPGDPEQGDMFVPANWQGLAAACADVARGLGLQVETEVYVGRRIWGARRRIDVHSRFRAREFEWREERLTRDRCATWSAPILGVTAAGDLVI